MKANIFAGSRRLALLAGIIWAIGVVMTQWPTRQLTAADIKQDAEFLFGGWIVLWLLTIAIGWIVRGFLGIPWGKDRRSEDREAPL